jgi:hypothetical protein
MIRTFIASTIIVVMLMVPNMGRTEPTQLLPCEVLHELSYPHKVYSHYLLKYFRENANLENKAPVFTMLVMPSFEPEWMIIVYQIHNRKFIIEKITAKENIWYSLARQAQKQYGTKDSLHYDRVPLNATFVFSSPHLSGHKVASAAMVNSLQSAIEYAIKKRIYNEGDYKTKRTFLDGTSVYFFSADNACGFSRGWLVRGPAQQLLIVGDMLEKYLSGQAKERDIIKSAEKVFKGKE